MFILTFVDRTQHPHLLSELAMSDCSIFYNFLFLILLVYCCPTKFFQ